MFKCDHVISILFNCIDTLLNCRTVPPYASCVYNEVLSNRFNSFFMEKINTICFSIVGDFDADILCSLSDVQVAFLAGVGYSSSCFIPE